MPMIVSDILCVSTCHKRMYFFSIVNQGFSLWCQDFYFLSMLFISHIILHNLPHFQLFPTRWINQRLVTYWQIHTHNPRPHCNMSRGMTDMVITDVGLTINIPFVRVRSQIIIESLTMFSMLSNNFLIFCFYLNIFFYFYQINWTSIVLSPFLYYCNNLS